MSDFMHFPAPKRMSVEGPNGTYFTAAWTVEAVLAYKAIGGWFVQGRHEFADMLAARAAGTRE